MCGINQYPEYDCTKTCVTIYDSYKVRKWNMYAVLRHIRVECPSETTDVFKRSLFSLKMEWICHNFLYNVGYQRDRTKDVDLDNPCDHPEWEYIVCGLLVWLFVW